MSLSTLKRRLQSFNLARGRDAIDVDMIREAIRKEMDGPGCLFGYRSMFHSLRMGHRLTAPRDLVQRLMKEIDPDGCELRKKEGSDAEVTRAWALTIPGISMDMTS